MESIKYEKSEFPLILDQVRQYLSGIENFSEEIISYAGSRVIGLASDESSDYDLWTVYKGDNIYDKQKLSMEVGGVLIHIDCCSLQTIIDKNKDYNWEKIEYPSILHSSEEQVESSNEAKKEGYFEDFYRGVIYKTLLSDNVWMLNNKHNYCDLFENILYPKAIADYYFSRAWGNYNYHIMNKPQVLVRKYLYTIHEILYCKWLLQKNMMYPPFEFMKLLSLVEDQTVLDEIYKLYTLNKIGCGKAQQYCLNSEYLNQYLDSELNRIVILMQ